MELYNSQTHSFSTLSNKYDNFLKPAFKVKVGGKDLINDLQFAITGVSINQTLECKSGSLKFTIQNAYDIKARTFNNDFYSVFESGETVECSLGYGSNLSVLFSGFVGDVTFSFTEGSLPSVIISCVDIRSTMLQGKKNAMPPESAFNTITRELLDNYSSQIITKLSSEDTWNKDEKFKQNTRDFKYIYDYAKSRNHEFFVLGEYIYLVKKGNNKAPITTLEWGESVLSFSRSYSNVAIKVIGIRKEHGNEVFRHEKDTESPMNFKGGKVVEKHIDVTDAKNNEDVIAKVESYVASLEDLATGGIVKCVGLPEIVPGRFIKLDKLDKNLNNSYYITSVDHSFSSGGYTTSFNITREE